ncbi:patatin-like phospholipase family protein [Rubrimonas sp.]|uniref:patatin-like phospholipase family protein n=1 Tax=Rubrimonas sp. TaxID=2036015 RepID=UPI003FA7D648
MTERRAANRASGGRLRAAALPLAVASLAACGRALTRRPVPDALAEDVAPFGRPGLRSWGDGLTEEEFARFIEQTRPRRWSLSAPRSRRAGRPTCISSRFRGGGRWGAFGAGALNGRTERGDRPGFKGVSSVSTGAMIAPFAFLGPAYDGTLREIYTAYAASSRATSRPNCWRRSRPSTARAASSTSAPPISTRAGR